MTTTPLSPQPLIVLSYEEAVDLLNRAVAEQGPDFVYTDTDAYENQDTCSYFYKDAPSCIVGHAIAYKGVDADRFTSLFGLGANWDSVEGLVGKNVLGLDEKARIFLLVAQDQQDGGAPWGDAVALAIWCAENGTEESWTYHYGLPALADEEE